MDPATIGDNFNVPGEYTDDNDNGKDETESRVRKRVTRLGLTSWPSDYALNFLIRTAIGVFFSTYTAKTQFSDYINDRKFPHTNSEPLDTMKSKRDLKSVSLQIFRGPRSSGR